MVEDSIILFFLNHSDTR